MIRGYAAKQSVWPGQALVLHVSAEARRFRAVFYRWVGRLVHMLTSAWMHGERAPERSADVDWCWPAYRFTLPRDWPSGIYVAHLEHAGAAPPTLALSNAAVLFVVRGQGRGLLYKLPLATYNAYNYAGGGCFYANPPRSDTPPGARLSFRRPGIGIGGPVFGTPDHYDAATARQTFAHWDARLIRWLLRQRYAPDFCTDLDIHDDPGLCQGYRLLLSAGHDEYWSEPMRDGVEHFIDNGGNAAFFSANLCWWRIHLVEADAAMVCHQGGPEGPLDRWRDRPEDSLAGVSYRHAGGWWDGPRSADGYCVITPEHWVFAGTGLAKGASFGADTSPPLVGYECDGAPLAAFDRSRGMAELAPMAGACGTRAGFQLLAVCALDERWQERPSREPFLGPIHAATMGICSGKGTVFTAATTDWAQVLDSAQEPHVETITRNVIERLLERTPTSSHGGAT